MERRFSEARLAEEYAKLIDYPIDIANGQRTIGPRAGMTAPSQGSEVCITNLPHNMQEPHIIPYLLRAGNLYKFRLVLPSAPFEARCAYATYTTPTEAKTAITYFHNREIQLGYRLNVRKAMDNRRLFLGGIPEIKTKDEIWHELMTVGMKGIVDVIMYRSYTDKNKNRGFVFVEFSSYEEAMIARRDCKNLILFGQRVHLDWSTPLPDVADDTMNKVKKLFLRNLSVSQERSDFEELLIEILGTRETIEKVYKFRDYAFIHFTTRRDAQRAMCLLKDFFSRIKTDVQVEWAKPPPNKFNNHIPKKSNEVQFVEPHSSHSQENIFGEIISTENMGEEIIERFPGVPIQTQEKYKIMREEKHMEFVYNNYTDGPAFNTHTWKEGNQSNRHLVTRMTLHGFHHLICTKTHFHYPEEDCTCTQCLQPADRYHILKCEKREGSQIAQDLQMP